MTDERAPQSDPSYHIQAGDVGAIGPGAHGEIHHHVHLPPAPPPASRPTDWLPYQPTPLFQERPGEFAKLETLLFGQNSSGRVGLVGVGVVGMGGVGKTYLAVEVATRYKDRFPDGIFWMTATGSRLEWQRELAALSASTHYLPPDDNPAQSDNELRRAQYFARYLAEHEHALLVLDNVEQPELITSVLPAIAGVPLQCALLYTARVQDMPTGFQAHAVDRLTEVGALTLLLGEHRPALLAEALKPDSLNLEARAARDLCRKVENLPLALTHLRGLLKKPESSIARLLQTISERGVNAILKDVLFKVFALSWEQISSENARRLFVLAGYFPEAAPIPLWLMGLAAGLGERDDAWEPLGEACDRLSGHSLVDLLTDGAIRLHPLVREFSQSVQVLSADERERLKEEAGELLVTELTDLGKLEARARAGGYWACLEQVWAAASYTNLLGSDPNGQLALLERWLDRESHVLGQETLWPERLPGLFYQQLANRAMEEGLSVPEGMVPPQWVRQMAQVGAEDKSLLRIFKGHQGGTNSVAFSCDGRLALTGGADGTARVWEVASGRELVRLWGHYDGVTSVAFSPDGKLALTGSGENDKTARVWEVASGRELVRLWGHHDTVTSVAFSSDGRLALTGSYDRTARMWAVDTGQEMMMLVHQRRVNSVAFSPDGRLALTGTNDNIARVWAVDTGQEVKRLENHRNSVFSVAFSSDGKLALTGGLDKIARVWEVSTWREVAQLEGHQEGVRSIAFSPDGRLVLTGGPDRTARLWAVDSGRELVQLEGHEGWVTGVAFSPDGRLALTSGGEGTARLWAVDRRQELVRLEGHQRDVRSVAFSPDGRLVLTGSWDKTVRIWEVASGREVARLDGHKREVTSVAFSPDGQQAMTGSWDKTARVWEVRTGLELAQLEGHQGDVTSVAFSPDGQLALTGSFDGSARVWDLASRRELACLKGHQHAVYSVAFSPDGRLALTGGGDRMARVWLVSTGQEVRRLEGHQEVVNSVAFSPNGRQVLTGSDDKLMRVWEVATGQELARLEGHQGVVYSVAFSPDGQIIISCDGSGVWFWEWGESAAGQLSRMYPTVFGIKAIHWLDHQHLLLADSGGPRNKPNMYRLKLEGL